VEPDIAAAADRLFPELVEPVAAGRRERLRRAVSRA